MRGVARSRSTKYLLGIDISRYQDDADADTKSINDAGAVYRSGVRFAFIRGYSPRSGHDVSHDQAKAALSDAGVLCCSYVIGYNDTSGASLYKSAVASMDLKPQEAIMLDIEAGWSISLTNAKQFVDAADEDGREVIVYGVGGEIGALLAVRKFIHPFVAAWSSPPSIRWTFWQFGSGTIPGVDGNPTDKDWFNGTQTDLENLLGGGADMALDAKKDATTFKKMLSDLTGIKEENLKTVLQDAAGHWDAVKGREGEPTNEDRKASYDWETKQGQFKLEPNSVIEVPAMKIKVVE